MAGVSAPTSVRARTLSARTTARGGLTALVVGLSVAIAAVALGSNSAFLVAATICGIGFGPAFGGVFRELTDLAPAARRAELVSSILTVAYLAFSLPALIGIAVTEVGLRPTAGVYGAVLIGLGGLALLLSGKLADTRAAPDGAVSG